MTCLYLQSVCSEPINCLPALSVHDVEESMISASESTIRILNTNYLLVVSCIARYCKAIAVSRNLHRNLRPILMITSKASKISR